MTVGQQKLMANNGMEVVCETGAPLSGSTFERDSAAMQDALKRGLDVLLATAIIVALLPLLLVIAGLIWRRDGAPVVYRHTRIGRGGRAFACLKFRTMVRDSDAALAKLLAASPDAREEWETHHKLRNDPRILGRVGHLLRRTSLDELPQLWNVLQGDMSLVGPRPVTHDELFHYGDVVDRYFAARPGLTGPWQVSGRSDTSFSTRVALDVHYVENMSLRRDLWILVQTVFAVLAGKGAY